MEPDWEEEEVEIDPDSTAGVVGYKESPLGQMQKEYSAFKARCQDHGVWDRFHNQRLAIVSCGHGDWDARKVLMPIWENFLAWLDAGNKWQNWDFDRFKPKNSSDKGGFEAFEIEITRKTTVYELLMQDQLKQRLEYEAGKSKKVSVLSDDTITLGSLAGIKLRTPNSTVTRAGEVDWAYKNLFAYQKAMEDKHPDQAKDIMEGAPSFGACSQLQFAYMNPANFMSNLNKNSPPKDERPEGEVTAENRYEKMLRLMEETVQVTCPNCASKF